MNEDMLRSDAQRQVAAWVRGIPEETPSMAWRAALNEKVRAESERRAHRRWQWSLARPGLGLLVAATLAVFVFVPRPLAPAAISVAPASGRLEAGLVALHDESVRTDDVVGSGLRPTDDAPTGLTATHDPLEDLDAGAL